MINLEFSTKIDSTIECIMVDIVGVGMGRILIPELVFAQSAILSWILIDSCPQF